MFATNIKDNLTFYSPDTSQVEIDVTLRTADLDNFVISLKGGSNIKIGENGRGIFGG